MNGFDFSSPCFEDAELSIKVDGVLDVFPNPPAANYEALLATPEVSVDGVVPEPDQIALMLIGGTAFGIAVRRKVGVSARRDASTLR